MEQTVSTNERLKDGGGNARKTATEESTKIVCRLLASAHATCTLSALEKTPFHSCTLCLVVARFLVVPPDLMNQKREVFCSKLSPTRRMPREIERKLQAYPTQLIETDDDGLRETVSLL